jgi:hypothetical protein
VPVSTQIAGEGQVPVALGDGLLIHPEVADDPPALPNLAAPHRPFHQVPSLVPAEAENPGRPSDAALPQDIDGQPLEQAGEAGLRLGPRHRDLDDPVRRTLHPRDAGVESGAKVAAVEVTPDALLGVIIEPQRVSTLRAWPGDALGMRRPDIDLAALDVQLDPVDGPGSL